ncbi:hypothetical protein H696_00433 [Fonticula alba]|uniref:Choice-of-anchor I domain-containing protein n=1 Tax=Fonticula alba TaxID=691883 RepID=A0A058ZEM6_FONAL|nr:hypothetical protein H696_00433 [Fonticula alba]KCV72860.1 hypothetical protein H696_00433 [Fonticula alba]|eukprot:XP_009492561.1 hypothetical protein H696_00433 [Fonticula alba]
MTMAPAPARCHGGRRTGALLATLALSAMAASVAAAQNIGSGSAAGPVDPIDQPPRPPASLIPPDRQIDPTKYFQTGIYRFGSQSVSVWAVDPTSGLFARPPAGNNNNNNNNNQAAPEPTEALSSGIPLPPCPVGTEGPSSETGPCIAANRTPELDYVRPSLVHLGDSGASIPHVVAQHLPDYYNSRGYTSADLAKLLLPGSIEHLDQSTMRQIRDGTFDATSTLLGANPAAITTGTMPDGQTTLVFVGLRNIGAVAIYTVEENVPFPLTRGEAEAAAMRPRAADENAGDSAGGSGSVSGPGNASAPGSEAPGDAAAAAAGPGTPVSLRFWSIHKANFGHLEPAHLLFVPSPEPRVPARLVVGFSQSSTLVSYDIEPLYPEGEAPDPATGGPARLMNGVNLREAGTFAASTPAEVAGSGSGVQEVDDPDNPAHLPTLFEPMQTGIDGFVDGLHDPVTERLFFINSLQQALYVFDAATGLAGKPRSTLDLRLYGYPTALALHDGVLLVTIASCRSGTRSRRCHDEAAHNRGQLAMLEAASLRRLGVVRVGYHPTDVEVSADGRYIVVTNAGYANDDRDGAAEAKPYDPEQASSNEGELAGGSDASGDSGSLPFPYPFESDSGDVPAFPNGTDDLSPMPEVAGRLAPSSAIPMPTIPPPNSTVIDPPGSVSVIVVQENGIFHQKIPSLNDFDVTDLDFSEGLDDSIILYDSKRLDLELEPNRVAFTSDPSVAIITMQTNNAWAMLDLTRLELVNSGTFGSLDHNDPAADVPVDSSSVDGIRMQRLPIKSMRMPGAMAPLRLNSGHTVFVSADGGRIRRPGRHASRLSELTYDPRAFPGVDLEGLKDPRMAGDLVVANWASFDSLSPVDGDEDYTSPIFIDSGNAAAPGAARAAAGLLGSGVASIAAMLTAAAVMLVL